MKRTDTGPRRTLAAMLAIAACALAAPAPAQDGGAAEDSASVEEVIVVARRAEAPIWEVSNGTRTLILVGTIAGVPRDAEWRPEALEAAVRRADRILLPQEGRATLGDVMRLIWRIRTVSRLPEGTTTADYLRPEVQARLEAVMAGRRDDRWRTTSLFSLSLDLINDHAGFERSRGGALDITQRTARQARIPAQPIGIVRGDEAIDNLINLPPGTYAACVEAAVGAAEVGPAGAAARVADWRARRVPAVIDQPLDRALGLCWPSGDPEIAPLLRRQWAEAIASALEEPGVTLAVAQLRLLAEPGGVLDQLEARGLTVEGPRWKRD